MFALRQRLVTDIVATVQLFAILGFAFSVVGIYVRADLRIVFEFALVGIAIASTIVLLIHEKREEAATAIWFGAVVLMFTACDLAEPVGIVVCSAFAFLCIGLMRLIAPVSIDNRPHE